MIKNVMSLFAVASILVTVSCKKQDPTAAVTYDANNMVVAQEKTSDAGPKRVKRNAADYPVIEIDNVNYDFGKINEGDKVDHIFKFKNTGKSDLIIINAKASCGCTIPEWTKTPVKPGESGEIKIIFNSAGKSGVQHKTVTLTTNTEAGNEKIDFKVDITPNPNSPFNKNKK